MNFCPKCGAELKKDVPVCENCGYNTQERTVGDESKLLKELGGQASIIIYGKSKKDGKWLFFRHPGDLQIYDSYFKFSVHKISITGEGKHEGYINHEGIISFESLISLTEHKKKLKPYLKEAITLEYFYYTESLTQGHFGFLFDSNYGWQEVSRFMTKYSGSMTVQLNEQLIKSKEEYITVLSESSLGPYIFFAFGVDKKDKNDKIMEDLISFLKSLKVRDPPVKISGNITVSIKTF